MSAWPFCRSCDTRPPCFAWYGLKMFEPSRILNGGTRPNHRKNCVPESASTSFLRFTEVWLFCVPTRANPWCNPDTRTLSTHTDLVTHSWLSRLLERRSINVRVELNSTHSVERRNPCPEMTYDKLHRRMLSIHWPGIMKEMWWKNWASDLIC